MTPARSGERARLACELERRLLPAFEDLVDRADGDGDEAALRAEVSLHAIALRRWVERLAASTPAVEPHVRASGNGMTCRPECGFGRSLTGVMFGLL